MPFFRFSRASAMLLASACALSSSCIPKGGEIVGDGTLTPSEPGGRIDQSDLIRDPSPLLNKVSELRQLKQKSKTPVLFQDDGAFDEMLRNAVATSGSEDSAFDSVPLNLSLSTLSPLELGEMRNESIDNDVAAFYDRQARAIVMKRSAAFVERDEGEVLDESAWTLAHETIHALQAQHFGLPRYTASIGEDQRLATRAVFEGDAMVGMLGYVASESWGDLYRSIVNSERRSDAEAEESYRLATGSGSDFDKTPLLYRERTLSPYRDGMRFMGSIYREGGFAAVNRVYKSLPSTTEQILHVEKYLAGERAHEHQVPTPPEGHSVIASTTVGELLLRATLDQCMAKGEADKVAAGWGGDHLTLSRKRDKHALTWSTSWDSEEDAEEFELAALQLLKCWKKRDREAHEDALFSGDGDALRKGNRVSLVYGYPAGAPKTVGGAAKEELAEEALAKDSAKEATTQPASIIDAALHALLDSPIKDQKGEPPLPGISFKPVPPLPRIRPPYLAQSLYVNEWWNLKLPIVPGVEWETQDDGVLLTSKETGFRMLALRSDWHITEASIEHVFDLHQEAMMRPTRSFRDSSRMTPLGNAYRRDWLRTNVSYGQTLIIPICNNMGSIVIMTHWNRKDGAELAEKILSGMGSYQKGDIPACLELNPARPE